MSIVHIKPKSVSCLNCHIVNNKKLRNYYCSSIQNYLLIRQRNRSLCATTNENINQHSCWNYTSSSIATIAQLQIQNSLATDTRVWQKKKKQKFFCESIGYMELTMKSLYILLVFVSCLLHILYSSKTYNQLKIYLSLSIINN